MDIWIVWKNLAFYAPSKTVLIICSALFPNMVYFDVSWLYLKHQRHKTHVFMGSIFPPNVLQSRIKKEEAWNQNLKMQVKIYCTKFKGIVHPKMKILSLSTHAHVVPNICSSSEHKWRYFWWIPRALWHPIDSKDPNMIKAQKRSKDIVKIIHVTSVVQP